MKEEKSFEGSADFVAWGTQVRSDPGTCAAPLTKRLQLACLTGLMLTLKRVSKEVLRAMLGLYIHPFCHRRALLSVFHRAYKWVDQMTDGTSAKLPPDIRDEFVAAMLSLPVAEADIRAPVSTALTCSDATPIRAGVVRGRVSQAFANDLYHASEDKGHYIRLDWDDDDWEQQPAPKSLSVSQQSVVDAVPWKVIREFEFSESSHVNLQEIRAAKAALRYSVQDSLASERLINLTDSRVALGAIGKGRSSAALVNGLLRSMVGWLVLGHKSFNQVYI